MEKERERTAKIQEASSNLDLLNNLIRIYNHVAAITVLEKTDRMYINIETAKNNFLKSKKWQKGHEILLVELIMNEF